MLGPPDPPAQLIEIGEAELVRAIDDDRVRIRNIEPAFDDRRANEHVYFPGYESRHDGFEFVRVHLAVADFNSGLRTKLPMRSRTRWIDIDPVVQK